jgi:hypothetical protein
MDFISINIFSLQALSSIEFQQTMWGYEKSYVTSEFVLGRNNK